VTPFEAIFVPADAADAVSDRAWLEALLAAERALAVAGSQAGLVSSGSAAMIAARVTPTLRRARACGARSCRQ
jgi:hypothetical protein